MSVLQTTLRTARIDDGCHVVLVAGELDLDVAPRLQSCLADLVESGADAIVVDLLEVTFVDSAGVAALVEVGRLLRAAGGELIVVADSPSLTSLLSMTDADSLFRMESSLFTAVDHVVERDR